MRPRFLANQPALRACMALWNLYFVIKLGLYFSGYIDFHVLENLAFAVFLLLPLRGRVVNLARQIIAIPVAIALLYYDSWLPSFDRVQEEASRVLAFSNSYLLELIGRFISWPVVLSILVISVIYVVLAKRFKLTPIVFVALFTPLLPLNFLSASGSNAQMTTPDFDENELKTELDKFFVQQAPLAVRYRKPSKNDVPFDIIFLHVCSMSWDDLQAIGENTNPFFNRFDILFTRFNSATAYSGPAMIRFHHSSCGQAPHDDMYDPAAPPCHTMNALSSIGFKPYVALNHDGHEGSFLQELREIGLVTQPPMNVTDLTPLMYSYDDSPVYSNYDVLSKWWDNRTRTKEKRSVLYYNTITMHDGTRITKEYSEDSLLDYKPRALTLFSDIDRFIAKIETSGRRAVIVFIPEHGANLRGDQRQIAGMREIPSPTISTVPVAIKLIGPTTKETTPFKIDTPSSYFAVTTLISRFIAQNPFNTDDVTLTKYIIDLPQTPFVAENNRDTLIMAHGGHYFMLTNRETWSPYKP